MKKTGLLETSQSIPYKKLVLPVYKKESRILGYCKTTGCHLKVSNNWKPSEWQLLPVDCGHMCTSATTTTITTTANATNNDSDL